MATGPSSDLDLGFGGGPPPAAPVASGSTLSSGASTPAPPPPTPAQGLPLLHLRPRCNSALSLDLDVGPASGGSAGHATGLINVDDTTSSVSWSPSQLPFHPTAAEASMLASSVYSLTEEDLQGTSPAKIGRNPVISVDAGQELSWTDRKAFGRALNQHRNANADRANTGVFLHAASSSAFTGFHPNQVLDACSTAYTSTRMGQHDAKASTSRPGREDQSFKFDRHSSASSSWTSAHPPLPEEDLLAVPTHPVQQQQQHLQHLQHQQPLIIHPSTSTRSLNISESDSSALGSSTRLLAADGITSVSSAAALVVTGPSLATVVSAPKVKSQPLAQVVVSVEDNSPMRLVPPLSMTSAGSPLPVQPAAAAQQAGAAVTALETSPTASHAHHTEAVTPTNVGDLSNTPSAPTFSPSTSIRLTTAAPETNFINFSAQPATPTVRIVPTSSFPQSSLAAAIPSPAPIRILPTSTSSFAADSKAGGSVRSATRARSDKVQVVSMANLARSSSSLPTVLIQPTVQQTTARPVPAIVPKPRISSVDSGRTRVNVVEARQDLPLHPLVEAVSTFKCRRCGFLAATASAVEEHCLLDHSSEVGMASKRRSRLGRPSANHAPNDVTWLGVAVAEGIKLQCPFCPNQFVAERSFKVHAMDDHERTEEEAGQLFVRETERRREKTIEVLRAKRKAERERCRTMSRVPMEAYLDEMGELKVRACHNEEGASVVKASQPCDNRQDDDLAVVDRGPTARKPKRARIGRPRGSRTIGITQLRRTNSNVVVSEARMGPECGVSDCAVRLADAAKLDQHRRSHLHPNSPLGFKCLECEGGEGSTKDGSNFETWSQLALHLWRRHRVDMGLFACNQCETFRCFTKARLKSHQMSHRVDRPCLCQECGKPFKTDKSLRLHVRSMHEGKGKANKEEAGCVTCEVCNRVFKDKRRLRSHLSAVHQKIRPHLCNYCGYAASNLSSLRLHLRTHTNEKPYTCGHEGCAFRTADHNSLRRHKMRHSGEKPYKCGHCDYSSIQASSFKAHLRSKHGEEAARESGVFKCGRCPFRTVKKGNYLAHVAENGRSCRPKAAAAGEDQAEAGGCKVKKADKKKGKEGGSESKNEDKEAAANANVLAEKK